MSPLSGDDGKRANQLANLRPNLANLRPAPPAPAGNARRRTHGAYAVVALERLAAREADVFAALAADAPLQEDGTLPPADGALVRLAAEALCRLDSVGDYLARRGIEDDAGELRISALDVEAKLRREAADHLDALGMSPRSRVRLGVDLVRAATSAAEVEESRAARERLDRRLADLEADVEEVPDESA